MNSVCLFTVDLVLFFLFMTICFLFVTQFIWIICRWDDFKCTTIKMFVHNWIKHDLISLTVSLLSFVFVFLFRFIHAFYVFNVDCRISHLFLSSVHTLFLCFCFIVLLFFICIYSICRLIECCVRIILFLDLFQASTENIRQKRVFLFFDDAQMLNQMCLGAENLFQFHMQMHDKPH